MQQIKKPTEQRPQNASLVDQYRAIGPAAILAALLHTKKRKTSIVSKAA
jgi:glycine cleavage system pyridoxal-binding protein P